MDIMVRLAMSGAKDTMLAQAVNAQNLANASTPGFRADLVKFLSEQTAEGEISRVVNSVDLRHGELRTTNRTLDVAVNGDGWMTVQADDGSQAFTRRGDLQVNGQGQLTNGAGLPIVGNNGPIALPPFAEIEIGSDGTISILPLGQGPNSLAVIDRIRLVQADANGLEKGLDGLLRLKAGFEAVPDQEVELVSGTLEGSNVNPIESLVRMIDLARQFESQVKIMDTAETNDQSLASVMRLT
ncbi:MAG: flagellar basal body rod protein FlgF [Pseudomonadota bacterium]